YTIQRDPRNCSRDPDIFRPERWLAEREDSEFINNHDTFLPFHRPCELRRTESRDAQGAHGPGYMTQT
ncbi:hypothetical protein B0H13DRAFT_1618470, partial [Mycena leptocephala]